jgi:DNA-binding NarL/FixJ family response regulator
VHDAPARVADPAPPVPTAGADLGVFLVDDHATFRDCLRALLQREPGLQVVGEAGDGPAALARAARCAPRPLADVVVLDVAMPGMNGIALAQRLRALAPGCRLLALSMHDEPPFVRAMLAAGAGGYLVKNDPLPEIVAALRAVARGACVLGRSLAPSLRQEFCGDALAATPQADDASANLPRAFGTAPMAAPRAAATVARSPDGPSPQGVRTTADDARSTPLRNGQPPRNPPT